MCHGRTLRYNCASTHRAIANSYQKNLKNSNFLGPGKEMKGVCPGNFPKIKITTLCSSALSPKLCLAPLYLAWWSEWSIMACDIMREAFVCPPPRSSKQTTRECPIAMSSKQRMAKIFEGKEDLRAQENKHSSAGDIPATIPTSTHFPSTLLIYAAPSHHFVRKPLQSRYSMCQEAGVPLALLGRGASQPQDTPNVHCSVSG